MPISAPDLVCGVIKHGDNAGAALLRSFHVELPTPDPSRVWLPPVDDLDPDARALLEEAARIAAELGDAGVGPEHIVLAGAEAEVDVTHAGGFRILGMNPALLREQLLRLRAGRTDLLEPVVDEAYLAEVESALHALADEARS